MMRRTTTISENDDGDKSEDEGDVSNLDGENHHEDDIEYPGAISDEYIGSRELLTEPWHAMPISSTLPRATIARCFLKSHWRCIGRRRIQWHRLRSIRDWWK
jgi:hypothetical protein